MKNDSSLLFNQWIEEKSYSITISYHELIDIFDTEHLFNSCRAVIYIYSQKLFDLMFVYRVYFENIFPVRWFITYIEINYFKFVFKLLKQFLPLIRTFNSDIWQRQN